MHRLGGCKFPFFSSLLAFAKILGVIAILTKKSNFLKEWAYAGFFFDFVLALTAHLVAGDGGYLLSSVALIVLIGSRFYDYKVFGSNKI